MTYKDPEKQRAFQRYWQREQRLKRRLFVINKMGGKCAMCKCDNPVVLQIDHIKPQLAKKGNGWSGSNLVNAIYRKKKSTKGLQLLCANCHRIKTVKRDMKEFATYNKNIFVPKKKS